MIYDKKIFHNLGNLLIETIPEWEKIIFHNKKGKDKSEWNAEYLSKNSKNKKQLIITSDILKNLLDLETSPTFPQYPCDILFFRNGKYEVKIDQNQIPINPPDKKTILRLINEIQNIDLKNADIDNIKKLIGEISRGYIQPSPILPKGSKFYRGVLHKDKPENIKQVSYPPPNSVKKLHRAGRIEKPLFYCSTARETPVWELSVTAGDRLVISHWETNEALLVNNVGYHTDVFCRLNSVRTCPSWGDNLEPNKVLTLNELIRAFFSNEFAREVPHGQEYLYKVSIAIAEHHFQQNIFAGLLYPTLAMKGNADNLALKPEVVDKYLLLNKVEYIIVEEVIENENFKVKIIDFANSFNSYGQIEWKGRRPQWVLKEKGELLNFSVENNQWVAKNSKGEIVEPE